VEQRRWNNHELRCGGEHALRGKGLVMGVPTAGAQRLGRSQCLTSDSSWFLAGFEVVRCPGTDTGTLDVGSGFARTRFTSDLSAAIKKPASRSTSPAIHTDCDNKQKGCSTKRSSAGLCGSPQNGPGCVSAPL